MSTPAHQHEWDAGELGCGEIVVKLKLLMRDEMQPGEVIRLTATDEGIPEDMPAWCSLTGNPLLHADPPVYHIQKKLPV